MRVALLSRSAHPIHAPGGMERAVYALAKHLRELGVDVTLFTRPGKSPEAFPGRVETIKYQHFRVGPHGRILDRTGAMLARLETVVALTAYLERFPKAEHDEHGLVWGRDPSFRSLASLPVHVSAGESTH